MYNVGFQTLNNISIPDTSTPKKIKSNSLLARNTMPSINKQENIRQRVGRYVGEIRKARMELKNG
tara:strand:- start:489 stop:683 length:195 start_codon:yes stop_codon:yes gene_type:complete